MSTALIQKGEAWSQVPCAASANFVANAPVFFDANGRAEDDYATGLRYAGTSARDVDNSSGAAAAVSVPVVPVNDNPGTSNRFLQVTLTGAALADQGAKVYWTSSVAVTKTAGSDTEAGIIWRYVKANTVIIDTMRFA